MVVPPLYGASKIFQLVSTIAARALTKGVLVSEGIQFDILI